MLQGDSHAKGRLRGLRIGFPDTWGRRLRRRKLRSRLQRRLFEHDRAMWYLHLARDVQVMSGI